jgi:hypothetical protein
MAVVVPAPVMAVMTPAHLFRLQAIDFALAGDRRVGIALDGQPSVGAQHVRRQRCGLGGGGDRGSTRNNAQRDLQEIPAFHDIFPLSEWRVMRTDFRRADMNAR